MNKEKWLKPNMPAFRLMVKLGEETGEVAKAFNDAIDAPMRPQRLDAKLKMVRECDHVVFIAATLRENVQADIEAGRY